MRQEGEKSLLKQKVEQTEAELKAAEEEEADQEVIKLHLLQERDKQRDLLRQTKHAR